MPINYYLKSDLEKEAILNSFKLFLKTCDFNIQILIQSKKENLSILKQSSGYIRKFIKTFCKSKKNFQKRRK